MDYRDTLPLPLLPTGSVFKPGGIRQLAPVARSLGMQRPLLVTDRGLATAGEPDSAANPVPADSAWAARVLEAARRGIR